MLCKDCYVEVVDEACTGSESLQEGTATAKGKAAKTTHGISTILLISAMVALFVCSFFVGIDQQRNYKEGPYSLRSIFYFFDEVFQDIEREIHQRETAYWIKIGQSAKAAFIIPAILTTIANVIGMIVPLVMLVLSAVKCIRGKVKGKPVNLMKNAAWSFGAFLCFVVAVAMYNGEKFFRHNAFGEEDGWFYGVTTGAIVGLSVGGALIFTALILRAFSKTTSIECGYTKWKAFAPILGTAMITAALVLLALWGIKICETEKFAYYLETTILVKQYTPYGVLERILWQTAIRNSSFPELRKLQIYNFIVWGIALLTIVAGCIFLVKLLGGRAKEKERKQPLVWAIVVASLAVLFLVGTILQNACVNNGLLSYIAPSNSSLAERTTTCYGPIIATVLLFVPSVAVIITSICKKVKRKTSEPTN